MTRRKSFTLQQAEQKVEKPDQAVMDQAHQAVMDQAHQAVMDQAHQAVMDQAHQVVMDQANQAVMNQANQVVMDQANQVVMEADQAVIDLANQIVAEDPKHSVGEHDQQEVEQKVKVKDKVEIRNVSDAEAGCSSEDSFTDDVDVKVEKRKIWKNIILLSVAFFCNYTAMLGLSKLQSSLHVDEGLGVICNSVFYMTLIASCFVLPYTVICLAGHKWTIVVCFSGNLLWMLANGHATWATMVTASIIAGPCSACLWTAQGSFFTLSATRYARFSGEEESVVMTRFLGVFYLFYQLSDMTGSTISSTVLRQPHSTSNSSAEDVALYCGMNDCPQNNLTSPNWEGDNSTVWTMLIIYLLIATASVVITVLLVEPLPEDEEKSGKKMAAADIREMLMATVRHMKNPEQLLLIPFTIFTGVQQSFWAAEFTKSFVTCTVGIWMIGLITIPYGIVNGCVCVINGAVAQYIGRLGPFIVGVALQLTIVVLLFMWTPSPYEVYFLFIISILWGLADALSQIQLNGLYAAVFLSHTEAAFANYQLWESVGYFVSYSYSAFICTNVKAYIMVGCLLVGSVCYLEEEYRLARSTCEAEDDNSDSDIESTENSSKTSNLSESDSTSDSCIHI